MTTTARDFISLALKEAGVLGIGQTALPEDINDGFTILTRMLGQWQKKRWLVPNLIDISAVGNSLKSNPIGPGQVYNTARPDKIQAAYFVQLNGDTSNEVSYPLTPIWSYEDYATIALKEMNAFPQYFFYDAAFPYGNVFIWPIPTSDFEIHLVVKGPIGFNVELSSGEISAAGSGYVNNSYVGVPFVSSSGYGSGGAANVTVAGGIVTAVAVSDPGDGYEIGDVLTIANTDLGGTGSGFLWTVTNVTTDLDAEFNMPPEYEEAIHYNLCRRLTSMYQYPPNKEQIQLAKAALNTLRIANSQIPTLKMPPAYRKDGGSFSIYNADAR